VLGDIPGLVSIQACEMEAVCLASPNHKGEAALCGGCKWSPAEPVEGRDCFRSKEKVQFPRKEQAEYEARRAKSSAKRTVKLGKDRGRQKVGRRAAAAEKKTERVLVRSTRNSGRSNRDGDHVAVDCISLDTKFQSGNINPVVNLAELAKIKADARRAGNPIGALVLRNKFNVGVVVLAEEDWAQILQWISSE
jgi:hypothetical protein